MRFSTSLYPKSYVLSLSHFPDFLPTISRFLHFTFHLCLPRSFPIFVFLAVFANSFPMRFPSFSSCSFPVASSYCLSLILFLQLRNVNFNFPVDRGGGGLAKSFPVDCKRATFSAVLFVFFLNWYYLHSIVIWNALRSNSSWQSPIINYYFTADGLVISLYWN